MINKQNIIIFYYNIYISQILDTSVYDYMYIIILLMMHNPL